MAETIARLQAYANAGADCPYAPGISTPAQIREVVDALADKLFNLLVGSASKLTVAEISASRVMRISVGGALARSAWGGFMRTAQLLASEGRFDGFANAASGKELKVDSSTTLTIKPCLTSSLQRQLARPQQLMSPPLGRNFLICSTQCLLKTL
jgi:2-methylisocitrate lyase-like PEP mutase family enzyme